MQLIDKLKQHIADAKKIPAIRPAKKVEAAEQCIDMAVEICEVHERKLQQIEAKLKELETICQSQA